MKKKTASLLAFSGALSLASGYTYSMMPLSTGRANYQKVHISGFVGCRVCGHTNVTLYKTREGEYICKDCRILEALKEEDPDNDIIETTCDEIATTQENKEG